MGAPTIDLEVGRCQACPIRMEYQATGPIIAPDRIRLADHDCRIAYMLGKGQWHILDLDTVWDRVVNCDSLLSWFCSLRKNERWLLKRANF